MAHSLQPSFFDADADDADAVWTVFDLNDNSPLKQFGLRREAVSSLMFSPDEKSLLYVGMRVTELHMRVAEYRVQSGELIKELFSAKEKQGAGGTAYSVDGTRLAYSFYESHDDGTSVAVRIVDRSNYEILFETTIEHAFSLIDTPLAFSHDGNLLFFGDRSGSHGLYICDIKAQTVSHHPQVTTRITAIAVQPGTSIVALGNMYGNVVLFDVKQAKAVGTLRGHSGAVGGLRYVPDGTRLISGALLGDLCIWDAVTHERLRRLNVVKIRQATD